MRHGRSKALLLALAASGTTAAGQCVPEWSGYSGPHLDNGVWSIAAWDPDGAGPSPEVVVAGGNFHHAGSTVIDLVGLWDGTAWRAMGGGVLGTVQIAYVYDPDGGGPLGREPVIGGNFGTRIARFRGGAWQSLGKGVGPMSFSPYVEALTEHNGSLVVGGQFLTAGGIPVQGLARWDGASWHAFEDERAAGPLTLASLNGTLYAGGRFFVPGSTTERTGVLRWDEPAWVSLGANPPNDDVFALAMYRGDLVAAGSFNNAGQNIAAFDGASWRPLGSGLNGTVRALQVFDPDGLGPIPELLIAGGSFTMAGGQPASCIAAWDGESWTPLGAGASGTVRSMTIWNNRLAVGGFFFSAGGIASPGLAFWGCPQPEPCYPNCDSSTAAPVLNVGDFSCFLNAFTTGSPYANCDGSSVAPALNVRDFQCFLNRFAEGCP